MAILAAFFDRLGSHQPAATIAGFAFDPFTAATVPEINTAITHLREILVARTYESFAQDGKAMPVDAMVGYAHDQIDQARRRLKAVTN
jgi:hypothetical protein